MRLGAFAALFAALAFAASAGASTSAAHVSVPTLSPFTVRGTGFHARERVFVTLLAKGTQSKTIRATTRGRFTTTFARVSLGSCDMYTVRAKGNRGSSAILRVIPECAPSKISGGDVRYPRDPVFPRH
jgi:hypothetical protein